MSEQAPAAEDVPMAAAPAEPAAAAAPSTAMDTSGDAAGASDGAAAAPSESKGEAVKLEVSEDAIKEAIRKFLSSAADLNSLNMSHVKDHIKDLFGKKASKQYKDFIKNFTREELSKPAAADAGAGAAGESAGAGAGSGSGDAEEAVGGKRKGKKHRRDEDDGGADAEKKSGRKLKKLKKNADDEDAPMPDSPARDDDSGDDYTEKKTRKKSARIAKNAKKKKKAAKTKRAKGAPKKPKLPFGYFADEKRAEIKESGDAQYAGLDSKGITKKLNAVWKKMSAEAKAPYEKRRNEDMERYQSEMDNWRLANPEAAAAHDRKMRGELDPAEQKKKLSDMSAFDQTVEELKMGKRRKKNNEEDAKASMDQVRLFLQRMSQAYDLDQTANEDKKPAIYKMGMLREVQQQVSNVNRQEMLLDTGLLQKFKDWLTPLGDGSLPHLNLRSAIYDMLGLLKIDHETLAESEGLGKTINWYMQSKDETRENRLKCQALIEKWLRTTTGAVTSYKRLAEVEAKDALAVMQRRKERGDRDLFPVSKKSKRARIPQPATFDYAIRPTSAVVTDDEEGRGAGAGAKKEEGLRSRITKTLNNMNKSNSRSHALEISIEGRGL